MKQIKGYPPNIDQIRQSGLSTDQDTLWMYGDTLYNPSGKEIPADILYHESIHMQQQATYTNPEMWWIQYLGDKDFRQAQELEAYIFQYKFVRSLFPAKASAECLDELAENMSSSLYNLGLTVHQAATLIRKNIWQSVN